MPRGTWSSIAARGFRVLNSRSNTGLATYDGVEACGARLCAEVREFLARARQESPAGLASLSFVGYSAGGLFARAAAAQLHTSGYFDERATAIAPGAFATIATPHLGVGHLEGCCPRRVRGAICWVWGGRTMQECCLADGGGGNPPLLRRTAVAGSTWAQAAARFRVRLCYANALKDHTVPYETAAMRPWNPHRRAGDERQHYVVGTTSGSTCAPAAEQRRQLEAAAEAEAERARREGRCAAALRSALFALALVALVPLVVCLVTVPMAFVVLPAVRLVAYCTEESRRLKVEAPAAETEPAPVRLDQVGAAGAGALLVAAPAPALSGSDCHDCSPGSAAAGADGACAASSESGRYEAGERSTLSATQRQILPELCAQGWTRVEVALPGPHTHGIIIFRRRLGIERPGLRVIAHVVEQLASHLRVWDG
eukprot:g941.t1